ncbi:hypothetical protein QE429_000892 [Bacillus sp. SORGH_AS 510]|uniref:hypothetical protein n=1 Tax=Bacillus sp. SORGH_AS_0510 TaxID=3041771 RepID=UPI00277F5B41|nr:hypothetical protein [Bacillus sp. SORGH_AS_0510]MDQ1144065.1 hypothetical protein [Bacillus sp. SORGH_AS_0510]
MLRVKYKESPLWRVAGSLWLFVAIMNLIMFSGIFGEFYFVITLLFIFNFLMSGILTVFYFRITSIDYIRVNENILSIYKGLVLPMKKINLTEVEQGRVIGNRFVLILRNQKEVEINLKFITIKDFERMKVQLETYFPVL